MRLKKWVREYPVEERDSWRIPPTHLPGARLHAVTEHAGRIVEEWVYRAMDDGSEAAWDIGVDFCLNASYTAMGVRSLNGNRQAPLPQRRNDLRHLPDPTRHQRVPVAELGRERNWKVADSDPGDERGLRVPAVDRNDLLGGALVARPIIAVKQLPGGLRDRAGWALKKEALRAGSSSPILSPAEYRQWMIRQEKAIDEFHAQYEANMHTANCLGWQEFWEQRGEPPGGL